ncbi:hypothetical protein EXIGLDRAFT_772364 [Exidia glandulosa HHB12029]|uniref:Uncharacterized protein n=1 Tax=Exidia glandulosa HHB12029 TaxID=1314781 RepID=A0A165FCN4_EXIGL|nr:hypothetical protein EXIGLDRAFT_772364 [Exidia glandulosa HHB12029]
MREAHQDGRRVSIVIQIPRISSEDWNQCGVDRDAFVFLLRARVVRPLEDCFINLVISLKIHAETCGEIFLNILSTLPARYLGYLDLLLSDDCESDHRDSYDVIPTNLLGRWAPRLRAVVLINWLPEGEVVAALSGVREVTIKGDRIAFCGVALQFPKVQHLVYTVYMSSILQHDRDMDETASAILALGSRLRSLSLCIYPDPDDLLLEETSAPVGLESPAALVTRQLLRACADISSVDIEFADASYAPDVTPILRSLARDGPVSLSFEHSPHLQGDGLSPESSSHVDDISTLLQTVLRMTSLHTGRILTVRFTTMDSCWCNKELTAINKSVTRLHVRYFYLLRGTPIDVLDILSTLPAVESLHIDMRPWNSATGICLHCFFEYLTRQSEPLSPPRDPVVQTRSSEPESSPPVACSAGAATESDSGDALDSTKAGSHWPALREVVLYASEMTQHDSVKVSIAEILLYAAHIGLVSRPDPCKPSLRVSKLINIFGDDLHPLEEIFSSLAIDDSDLRSAAEEPPR